MVSLISHVNDRLVALGVDCVLDGDAIRVSRGGDLAPLLISSDPEIDRAFDKYRRARSIRFDADNRVLLHNTSLEVFLIKLAPSPFFQADQYSFSDASGNSVEIGQASSAFSFSFFDSPAYEKFFEARVKPRLMDTRGTSRRVSILLWSPITGTYTCRGRKTPPNFNDAALGAIKSCLFKVAVERDDCLSVWKPRVRNSKLEVSDESELDAVIPRASYDEDVVSFYKVAKSSPFPSQSFLAYYHVLEFYFLRVAETKLQDRLSSLLNSPSLRLDRGGIDKVIAMVRGQDARSDETEMLRSVLDRYVAEEDLMGFIVDFEGSVGEKPYSKRRKVFGEDVQVSPIKDHAVSNAAKAIKHIRNAIVHSSDRYKREDCHIPLSESEDIIEEFIPLVRFLAERVIYGAASK